MGLIVKRIGFAAAVILALLLPLVQDRTRSDGAEFVESASSARLGELQRRLTSARFRWTVLAERDAALALAETLAPGSAPPVLLRGFPSGAHSALAVEETARWWRALGEPAFQVKAAMVVYNDKAYSNGLRNWNSYAGTVIERASGAVACLALLPGTHHPDGRVHVMKSQVSSTMAPCLLLARFGLPGNGMGSWLDKTRWSFAESNGWLVRPRSFVEADGRPPWGPRFEALYLESTFRGPLPFGVYLMAAELSPPYMLGAPALHCLLGDAAACAAGVTSMADVSSRPNELPTDITLPLHRWQAAGSGILDHQSLATWWVSDLIRDQGTEKFVAFWKSDLSLEEGFRAAYGQGLGEWTRDWARRQWNAGGGRTEPRRQVLLGVTLRPSWPLLVLFWSLVALVVASGVARRRQVTV
ncbi:MAG: hypothetical protein HOP28_07175 [Gemmatimonadales bacterium]|nr:hypothetical protein [Gemmatimonadales bacterium]